MISILNASQTHSQILNHNYKIQMTVIKKSKGKSFFNSIVHILETKKYKLLLFSLFVSTKYIIIFFFN